MGLKLQLSSSVMTKKWWTVGVVVVVLVALGLYFGPKIYASFQEDDAPAATVDTSDVTVPTMVDRLTTVIEGRFGLAEQVEA